MLGFGFGGEVVGPAGDVFIQTLAVNAEYVADFFGGQLFNHGSISLLGYAIGVICHGYCDSQ
jgi:hypothetical protein